MKKESFTYAFIGILLIFLAVLLIQCDTSPDDKVPVLAEKTAPVDTATATPNTDTSILNKEELAIQEPLIVPKTEAPTAPKPIVKKSPVVKKNSPATPKPSTKKPPVVTVPPTKTPSAPPPVSTPTPKVETKPAPPPPIAPAPAPKTPKVKEAAFSLKSTKAVIKGTSTLHAWESEVTKMEGKGTFETKDDELVAIKEVEIKMEVKGIKSKEGKKMDNKTYETFQSDKNPYIIYTFSNAVVKINDAKVVTIEASGKLTMAGNTQSVSLSGTGKQLSNGDLQLSVSEKIKMTDYKMEPPVMFLGTIKVGNEITVVFDFVLEIEK